MYQICHMEFETFLQKIIIIIIGLADGELEESEINFKGFNINISKEKIDACEKNTLISRRLYMCEKKTILWHASFSIFTNM